MNVTTNITRRKFFCNNFLLKMMNENKGRKKNVIGNMYAKSFNHLHADLASLME